MPCLLFHPILALFSTSAEGFKHQSAVSQLGSAQLCSYHLASVQHMPALAPPEICIVPRLGALQAAFPFSTVSPLLTRVPCTFMRFFLSPLLCRLSLSFPTGSTDPTHIPQTAFSWMPTTTVCITAGLVLNLAWPTLLFLPLLSSRDPPGHLQHPVLLPLPHATHGKDSGLFLEICSLLDLPPIHSGASFFSSVTLY